MFHGEEAIDGGGVRKVNTVPQYLIYLSVQSCATVCFRWFFWARKPSMMEESGRLESCHFACCVILAVSWEKVPNGRSRCHTKKRIGACDRAHPSFGMTPTKFFFGFFFLEKSVS